MPLEPRLAHMLIDAAGYGLVREAAAVAVLLTERGLGGNDVDLENRLRRWKADKGPRAKAAWFLADRWARSVAASGAGAVGSDLGKVLALAFPDRVSRRRDSAGEHWHSAGGRAFRLDATSSLARGEWLAVGEVSGHASGARIMSAAALTEEEVLALFADQIETRHDGDFDPATGAVTPVRSRRLGAVRLSSGPDSKPDQGKIEQALLEGVRQHGLSLLPWGEAAIRLRQRTAFARQHDESIPAVDDESLIGQLDAWLPSLVTGLRRLGDIDPAALRDALEAILGWDASRAVDRLAPDRFTTPAGTSHAIDYAAAGGPTVEVRAQALFGLKTHPMVANGRVSLTLAITSPAGRPIQTSKDLPAFWAGSWREVAKEMRGRYPRHPWPDDPANAPPTVCTKQADARRDNP